MVCAWLLGGEFDLVEAESALNRSVGRAELEDQFGRVEIELPLEPGFTRRLHIWALLLARMRRLFLYVISRFLKNSQTVEGTAETERSVNS